MALSRKRRRELARLSKNAEQVWEEQLATLRHANRVLRQAGRTATGYAREDVAPRVRDAYRSRVAPVIDSRIDAVRDAVAAVSKANRRVTERAADIVAKPKPQAPGPSAFILIGLGLVAAAGVAYAAWQTFRADDDLWVEDSPGSEASV